MEQKKAELMLLHLLLIKVQFIPQSKARNPIQHVVQQM